MGYQPSGMTWLPGRPPGRAGLRRGDSGEKRGPAPGWQGARTVLVDFFLPSKRVVICSLRDTLLPKVSRIPTHGSHPGGL